MNKNIKIGRIIKFNYDTSFGESHIEINLRDQVNDNSEYYCEVQLEYFGSIIEFTKEKVNIEIDYEFFDNLYSKLINININEIFFDYGLVGFDGTNLNIYITNGLNDLNLSIWCHNHDIEKRKLTEINIIFNELLDKLNINKKLILD